PSTAVMTIKDAQTSIQFAAPSFGTPESGIAQIQITRTGPVAGVTSTVHFTAVAGTAIPGVDFTPRPDILVTFPPGSTMQTVTVPILADTLAEGNEIIALVLQN